MDLLPFLKTMAEREASDLFFSTGAPVGMKVEGKTGPVTRQPLTKGQTRDLAYSVMNDSQRLEFERERELDMALGIEGVGRFRLNVFLQRGDVALVVRFIKSSIPDMQTLQLPDILRRLVLMPRGLLIVAGSTGSGKSTTLASMIDYRNANRTGHILTIEDPIEYIHHHQKSIVNQREVGVDTHSFAHALRRAMREAPDVILVGEIRDRETMQQALTYAETGHLCLSTLHAANANKALRRIVNFFPESAHNELFMDLSMHLQSIISQRLVPGINAKRVPAVEIMLSTPYVRDLVQKGDIDGLHAAMEKGEAEGMQSFDQSLLKLYHEARISQETALDFADSRNNLSIKMRLEEGAPPVLSDMQLSEGDG